MKRLLLATHNPGKVAELSALLAAHHVELMSLADFHLPAPEETGSTFAENALIKARAAQAATGVPALADDSGLYVTALAGAPGIHTADWAPVKKDGGRDYFAAMDRIWKALAQNPDKSARFVCTLAYVWAEGQEQIFTGECAGRLVWPPRGENGFGYDPFFVPEAYDKTFAELPPEVKDQQSHRAVALRAFMDWLAEI